MNGDGPMKNNNETKTKEQLTNDDSIVTDEMIAHSSQLIPQQLTAKEDLLKVLGIEE